jgi:phosphatidylglycerophosphate synthase
VKPPTESHNGKGDAVEEWIDLHFFRPVGIRIAGALRSTRISADHVTMWALVTGLVAGHLFLYASPLVNFAGFLLFVVSELLDSVDGQLARIRGVSTRWGRLLDGIADTARFVNLYVHFAARLFLNHAAPGAWALVLVALASHSIQSGAIDFIRSAFLEVGEGRDGELDLPETVGRMRGTTFGRRLAAWIYVPYVKRQVWIFSRTVTLVRALRQSGGMGNRAAEVWRAAYRERQRSLLPLCGWLGQNIRIIMLGLLPLIGGPYGFFWLTIVPLNLVTLTLIGFHERNSALLLAPAQARQGVEA